jgi:hypothetical protein
MRVCVADEFREVVPGPLTELDGGRIVQRGRGVFDVDYVSWAASRPAGAAAEGLARREVRQTGTDQIVLSDDILARAAGFEVQRLGTLDAIHLATAAPLRRELDGFVTYDKELAHAATALGLPHLAPA